MYKQTIEGNFTLKNGILSGKMTITTITIEDGICTETVATTTMAYDFVTGASWGNETVSVTSTIIPKMIPVPKPIYAIIEELFMSRTDAGCEETPPNPVICANCPCRELCDWLCTHEAI